MATSDEARQAITDAIMKVAGEIHGGQSHAGDQIKALAEAWEIVKVRKPGTVKTL